MLNQPMLQTLMDTAIEWLQGQGVRPGKSVKTEDIITNGRKKNRKQRSKKANSEEVDDDQKKPSMKTATDVIKRILWDDKLDKDDFLVGYLDRFRGIVEKYFSAFSWEDIASVDYDVLAVPKHRIQYFKYRTQKIWDKPSRLDNVFGSCGSGLTIYDVISKYQADEAQSQAGAMPTPEVTKSSVAFVEPHSSGNFCTNEPDISGDSYTNEQEVSGDSCTDSSDSDDDGITVTIGATVNTNYKGDCDDCDEKEEDQELGTTSTYDQFWQDKMRPNYFLAVRVTDEEIRHGVEQVQDYLLDNEPVYGPCCILPQALHITLFTLGLDTPEQVSYAAEVLQRIKSDIISSLPKEPLQINGVSNFYNRVIYAKVHYKPDFMNFVDHLKLLVKEAGLEIRDGHDFVPHMTIMKVTRPVSRQKGSKNVDPWLYNNFEDMSFGQQVIDGIYLCCMGSERREDGFYMCPSEIHFV